MANKSERELLRLGAIARLEQLRPQLEDLQVEVQYLTELAKEGETQGSEGSNALPAEPSAPKRSTGPGNYQRTEAQRKALSRRMKKYWAERRKAANQNKR